MSQLVNIRIDHINPHPDNPRKELGDLTELAESIKANGILQNLTVVPYGQDVYDGKWEDEYRVIIGHRRLAASKKAGLETVPCAIVEMSEEEQIATMLTENMQRSDLTVYEQAKSFQQLSIDFGKTTEEIAAMSGFSETTVRKRTKLAELDEKKFKKACERGATLFDFAELDKLTDAKAREKCLDAIGTPNFRNLLKTELDEQKHQIRRKKWLEQLSMFATQIEKQGYVGEDVVDMNYYRNYGSWTKDEDISVPENSNERRYFYRVGERQIDLYVERVADPEEEEKRRLKEEERAESESRHDLLIEAGERHYQLRREFVLGFGAAKTYAPQILDAVMDAMFVEGARGYAYYQTRNYEGLAELANLPYEKGKGIDPAAFREFKAKNPERALLILWFWVTDQKGLKYVDRKWESEKQAWVNRYEKNTKLDEVYAVLEGLGYQLSDEEKQMRSGTHEWFDKEEEK